jgi:hypothetical protein
MPTPPDPQQPGMGRSDLRRLRPPPAADGTSPAMEPASGRRLVNSRWRRRAVALAPVLPDIEQHVRKGVANLSRRPQHSDVITTVQNRTRATERAVRRSREPRRHGLHPAPHGLLPGRLDQQVDVIALHGVVDDPKVPPLTAPPKAVAEHAKKAPAAQGRHPRANPQRYVSGLVRRHRTALHMVHGRPARLRPSPRTFPGPAPARVPAVIVERELSRLTSHGVECGCLRTRSPREPRSTREQTNNGVGEMFLRAGVRRQSIRQTAAPRNHCTDVLTLCRSGASLQGLDHDPTTPAAEDAEILLGIVD